MGSLDFGIVREGDRQAIVYRDDINAIVVTAGEVAGAAGVSNGGSGGVE